MAKKLSCGMPERHARFWRNYSGAIAKVSLPPGPVSARSVTDFLASFDLAEPHKNRPFRLGAKALPGSLATLHGHRGAVYGACPLGADRVLSWSMDRTLRLWSLEGEPIGAPWKGHENAVSGACLLGADRVLSWSWDKTLRLWSLQGEPIGAPWQGHEEPVIGACSLEEDKIGVRPEAARGHLMHAVVVDQLLAAVGDLVPVLDNVGRRREHGEVICLVKL